MQEQDIPLILPYIPAPLTQFLTSITMLHDSLGTFATWGQSGHITPTFSEVTGQRGEEIRRGYLTPAISGVPSTQHEVCIKKGSITPAILGAHIVGKLAI